MVMTAPVLSRSEIPMMTRVGFAGAISFSLFQGAISFSDQLIPTNPWVLSVVVLFEILIGGLIGYLVNIIFDAIATFTQVIGVQMGGSASNVFDPATNSSSGPVAIFYVNAALMIFLFSNGFYDLIQLLIKSFELVPLAALDFKFAALASNFLPVFGIVFVTALKFILPVLAVMVVTDIFVALVAKILPQANIYFLIMPNKLFLGMIIIGLTMAGFSANLNQYFSETLIEFMDKLFV